MRISILLIVAISIPFAVSAAEAPSQQTKLSQGDILRGQFSEERQMSGADTPIQTSGSFLVAPSRGLLWNIEKPFMTSTIITPSAIAQDLGGLAIKLPAKNLHHLYEMVGAALQGNWTPLESDFIVSSQSSGSHWQMLLKARTDTSQKIAYSSVVVTGSQFVDAIDMTKVDGTHDKIQFSNQRLSAAPLLPQEVALFSEIKP